MSNAFIIYIGPGSRVRGAAVRVRYLTAALLVWQFHRLYSKAGTLASTLRANRRFRLET